MFSCRNRIFRATDSLLHPLTAPIWITGLFALAVVSTSKELQIPCWCYLISFAAFGCSRERITTSHQSIRCVCCRGNHSGKRIERVRQGWLKPAIWYCLAVGAWFAPLVSCTLDRSIYCYMDTLPFKCRAPSIVMSAALPHRTLINLVGRMTANDAQAVSRIKPEERSDCGYSRRTMGKQ